MYEIVKDKIMYQSTNWPYKVGQKVYFGKRSNNQFLRAVDQRYNMKNGENALFYVMEKTKNNKGLTPKETNEIYEVLWNYSFTVRELAMEYCRRKYYKNYPSRLKSMYLCEKKEEAEMYLSSCKYKNNKSHGHVIKVKLNGKLFKTTNEFNRRDITFLEGVEGAHTYFKGVGKSYKDKSVEFLFEGWAEIVEIYD